jgi:hypothetical protein
MNAVTATLGNIAVATSGTEIASLQIDSNRQFSPKTGGSLHVRNQPVLRI